MCHLIFRHYPQQNFGYAFLIGGTLNRFGKQISAKNSSFFPDMKPSVKMSEADELSADLVDHLGPDLWSLPAGKPNIFGLKYST